MADVLEEKKDAAEARLSQAGEAVGEAVRQVHIEEFHLKGGVGDHPFEFNLEDAEGERYLAFDVTVKTEGGDFVRITGRKNLAGMMRQDDQDGADTVASTPARRLP